MPLGHWRVVRSGSGTERRKASLHWDTQAEAYRLKAPVSQELINFLKQIIPCDERKWDPIEKEWIFIEKYFEPMRFMVSKLWPESLIADRTSVEVSESEQQKQRQAQIPARTKGTNIEDAKRRFAALVSSVSTVDIGVATGCLEYQAVRKAYLRAIAQAHPDKGGDAVKAAELNILWSQIQKEVYNK